MRGLLRHKVQDLSRRDLLLSQDFSAEELRKRRRRVARKIGRNAHALIASAPPLPGRNHGQDALFYYLCGLETQHTYCLISGREARSTLFIPERSATGESPEDALGTEDEKTLRKSWLFDEVKPVSATKTRLATVSRSIYSQS